MFRGGPSLPGKLFSMTEPPVPVSPPAVVYPSGRVVGSFTAFLPDGPDEDSFPDSGFESGWVELVPETPRVLFGGEVVTVAPVVAGLDSLGGFDVLVPASSGVDGATPSGWAWRATVRVPSRLPETARFVVPAGGTVDVGPLMPPVPTVVTLPVTVPAPAYDDSVLAGRVQAVEDAVASLPAPTPPYDDSALSGRVTALEDEPAGFVAVEHGADGDTPRPDAVKVEWRGTAQPANASAWDTWLGGSV